MKNYVRILSLVLCVIFFAASIPVSAARSVANPFEDVNSNDYYYDAVIWAYEEGVTTGTTATKFAPASTCTRGQVVTFLWRAMGEPAAKSTENPFEDVKTSDYYYKAVLWAIEEGITTGTSAKRFSPNVTCTNAHILTFIWRALGKPDKTGDGEWYSDAVNWADNSGLIDGTFTGNFDPAGQCPRANVVTYLYRYYTSNVLTVYVTESGNDQTADGTPLAPFGTIEAARDYVRTVDKSAYTSVRVKIEAGVYELKDSIGFLKDDSGTSTCPIVYVGEPGTVISGGVIFSSSDFSKAEGDKLKYFPEESRDKLMMIDLASLGFPTDASSIKSLIYVGEKSAPLSVNGNYATVARYPNDTYASVKEGSIVNCEGGAAGIGNKKVNATIYIDSEHMEHVENWHDLANVYIVSRYASLSSVDNSSMISVIPDLNSMKIEFTGSLDPVEGMPFYWYNIPEELDTPGEYYIDSDGILYYYPESNFKTATFSISKLESSLITINGAEYISFSNITFESSRQSGITGDGNNITISGCTVRNCSSNGIVLTGNNIVINSNSIYSVGMSAVVIAGGDETSLKRSNNMISGNDIHDWSSGIGYGCYAVYTTGCGSAVSNNEIHDSTDSAISYSGPYHNIEFNNIYNVCLFEGDKGTIESSGMWGYGTVIRYNHIKDSGFTRNTSIDPDGAHGILLAEGESGVTVYGNVIENVTGNGIDIEGGRDNETYGNLIIKCRYAIEYDARYYDKALRDVSSSRIASSSWQLSNSYWRQAFPVVSKLSFASSSDNTEKNSLYFNAAPSALIKSNVTVVCEGISADIKSPYNISEYVFGFSRIEVPTDKNKTLREIKPDDKYSIEELINTSSSLSITVSQFRQIGISE